jgi:hypothetical protein
MKPNIADVLFDLEARLCGQIAPEISPSYHAGELMMIGSMQRVVAEEWDRAADRLVEENGLLRALFAVAAPVLENETLSVELRNLANSEDESFRISALEAANTVLRRALIDLHEALDGSAAPEAPELLTVLRGELVRSTERRKTSLDNF